MNIRRLFTSLLAIALLSGSTGLLTSIAADAPKTPRKEIYDAKADGAKQIADALAAAKADKKGTTCNSAPTGAYGATAFTSSSNPTRPSPTS